MSSEENKITFTVNSIPAKNNHAKDGMVALKKIEHFSYALSDEIGLGYSSHVYRGKNDKTNELVAIKVIDIKKEDDLHKQFTNDEVNILEKIKQSDPTHLLRLEGVFKTKNNLYIITEFCEGKDVAKILRRKKTLTEPEAQGIMKQFIRGYAELYKLEVVHRDLKLANIFVSKGRAVLADFGFAIESSRCDQKFEYNVGSPFYMPPQSLKFNRYSYKSDVWAIGVIAFELIFGKRPWKDRNDDVLFDNITTTRIEQLFDDQVSVSEEYKEFIKKCLTIDYDKRASPEEVINFEWPRAVDFIEGIQENGNGFPGRPASLAKQFSLQPSTTKHFTHKPNVFENSKPHQRQPRLSEGKGSKEIPLSLINNEELSKASPNINVFAQRNKAFLNQEQQQSGFEGPLKSEFVQISNIERPIQNQLQRPVSSFELGDQEIQNIILSQIHYFLSTLISAEISQISKLLPAIANKIRSTIDKVAKLEMEPDRYSVFSARKYLTNPRWQSLKKMIAQYQQKYKNQYGYLSENSGSTLEQELLANALTFLQPRFQDNERCIELLAYLYQVLELQNSVNIFEFSNTSRIQYLAENKNLTQSAENSERLKAKLINMGF